LPDPNGSAFSSQNPPRPDPFRSLITAETTAKPHSADTIIQLESLLPRHICVLKTQISPSIVESPHKWHSSILPLRRFDSHPRRAV
jgi:hypothetical protein